MKAPVFLDSNVLVYAAAGKATNPAEHAVARHIIARENFELSPLVIGEFMSVVRKPQNEFLSASEAQEWIDEWENHCNIDVDVGLIQAANYFRERYRIQFWDAAHIASAERLNIDTLYSEDMSHGQKYGSVTVINPFKAP
jgi:predicted nucleic acid-binding protein